MRGFVLSYALVCVGAYQRQVSQRRQWSFSGACVRSFGCRWAAASKDGAGASREVDVAPGPAQGKGRGKARWLPSMQELMAVTEEKLSERQRDASKREEQAAASASSMDGTKDVYLEQLETLAGRPGSGSRRSKSGERVVAVEDVGLTASELLARARVCGQRRCRRLAVGL